MEIRDLIKKLENTDIPEIEIKSHKAGLKFALLNSDYFKKRGILENIIKRYFYFSAIAFATLTILGIVAIRPKLTEARILGIAKNNPEIKKLIEEENMALSDVKVKDGKAYILLNSSGGTDSDPKKNPGIILKKVEQNASETIEGAIVEVDLKNKEVSQINSINGNDINPLNNTDKESARALVSEDKIINEVIPKEAKIGEVESSLSEKIDLVEKDNEIKAVSQPEDDKRARVNYALDGKKWVVKVNLDKKTVEEIQYSVNDEKGSENIKGRD